MPPYFTIIGNNLTVYFDLSSDTDGTLGNPIDNILAQLNQDWAPIAAANGLNLIFAFSSATPPPMDAIPAGLAVIVSAPPPNVQSFKIKVGHGASADASTQSGRVSYVNYQAGIGYIYDMSPNGSAPFVPAISHELGHILGLSDRYYDAAYWLNNWAINRTCKQIRQSRYFEPPNVDYRDGIADNASAYHDLPRLAVRASLPMSTIMVPADTQYAPMSNLMSTGAPMLTAYQINVIRSQATEQVYRKVNWVAVLGTWRRYPTLSKPPTGTPPRGATGAAPDFPFGSDFTDPAAWIYPAWEATPQDKGQGLLLLPPGSTTPYRYGCLSARSRGRDEDGNEIQATRLAVAKGKTRVFSFGGTTYNVIGVNSLQPNWMCNIRQMIADLIGSSDNG
jgi:hypothetical protein